MSTYWNYDYDNNGINDYILGVPTLETDPNNAQTRAEYDAFGRMTAIFRPGPASGTPVPSASLSMTYTNSYPFTTSITQHVDTIQGVPQYYTVTRVYDGMGRQTTSIEYPGLSVPLTEMSGGNYIYTDTEYVSATITKQSMPHLLNETALYTTTTSNIAARTVTVAAPDDTSTITTTDGLVTTVRDARGYDTKTITDVWGRTISVVPPTGTGPSLRYIYDPLGNMTYTIRGLDASINSSTCLNNPTSANCPSSTITALTYYEAGQKSSMTDPDMGAWSYEYDALGNLTKQTDARQCVTNLGYDTLNRLTTKTYANCPTTPNVSYYYDGQSFTFNGTTYNSYTNAIGRRSGMVMSGSNAAAWNYDMRGRATKETKVISTNSYITEWGYNSADLPTWMEYPDNEVVNYTYNSRMLLNSVSGTNTYVTSTGYDLAGRMTSRALGNTLTQAFTYNPWNIQGGRLQNLATGTLQNLSYTYDAVGNIKTITDARNANQKQCFQYDPLGRLTKATTYNDALQGCTSQLGAGNYNEIYTYNGTTGNLQAKAGVTLTYPTGNNPTRPHAVTSTNNATTLTTADDNSYSYDANGNMFTRTVLAPIVGNPNNKDVFDLSYDAENRLVQVKKNNVLNATFTYDADGRRVISVMGSETTHFVGAHYEVTNPGSGQTVAKYYFAGITRIAARKYTVPQNMTVEYLFGDHLGSTVLTTDSMGAKVSEIRYKPWGEIRSTWTSAVVTTPSYKLSLYTFTGQASYMDDPTTSGTTEGFGLMFYNARWYDPAIGRFAQADSIVPPGIQGYDHYAYVNNNPLRYTDPTGHMCSDPDDPTQSCDGADHPGEVSHGGGTGISGGGSNGGDDDDNGSSGSGLCQMYGECGGSDRPQFMPTQQDDTGCNDFQCALHVPNDPALLDLVDWYFDVAYWLTIGAYAVTGGVVAVFGGYIGIGAGAVIAAFGWYEASVMDQVRDEIHAAASSGEPLIIGFAADGSGIGISGEGDNRGTIVNTPAAFLVTYMIFQKQIDDLLLSP